MKSAEARQEAERIGSDRFKMVHAAKDALKQIRGEE